MFYGFFFLGGLSFRNKLREVFIFEITKTKTPKFDLKLGGKNRTEDNWK